MGIFEFLKKKQDKANEMDFAEKSEINSKEKEIKQEEKFVADLSYVELQFADWVKFAGILKREGVLSNSYDKNPVSVDYFLDKDNSPVVELTFKSKTSDSIRKVKLMSDINKLLTKDGVNFTQTIIVPESEVNEWYEVDISEGQN